MWLQGGGGSFCLTGAAPPPSPCTEKKCYRETYISDTLELDLHPASSGSSGGSGASGRRPLRRLSLLSADSCSSSHTSGMSGMEPGEMSVDEPSGAPALHGEAASCSSSPSVSSGPEGNAQDLGHGECVAAAPRSAVTVGAEVTSIPRTEAGDPES